MISNQQLLLPFLILFAFGCTDSNREEPASNRALHGSATDIRESGAVTQTDAADRADIGIGGSSQERAGNFETQPLPGQLSDSELEKKIRVALTTGSLGTRGTVAAGQLTSIKPQVRDGVVELNGTVASAEERRIIEARVRDCPAFVQ